MEDAARRCVSVICLAVFVGACGGGPATSVDSTGSLPARFTHGQIERGLALTVDGPGVERATLWTWNDHPAPVVRPFVSDEQSVPQPVATDDGDTAVAIRGGAFCSFVPTVRTTGDQMHVEAFIDAPTDEQLRERGIACSAGEEIVVISFELSDDVETFTVDGVAVPRR